MRSCIKLLIFVLVFHLNQANTDYLVPVCLPSSNAFAPPGCPLIKYHFPRDNQVADYVRYHLRFPRMTAATLCMWLETSDFSNSLTSVGSYATTFTHNEMVIVLDGQGKVRLYIHTEITFPSASPLHPGKNHVCVWFSSADREAGIIVNGGPAVTRSYSGASLRGGGSFLLGQEQDAINAGGLNAAQAYSGNVTNFMIWPRVLSRLEIDAIAHDCQCPNDYAIVMSLDRTEIFGHAYYSIPDVCPTL